MPPGVSGNGDLPPVPDDETPAPVNPQLPWSQIPKFTPGVTNVQEYSQKLKFLAALWPVDFLDQLAPRAALLVEGTAFKKIARIPPAKLKVKSTDGVAAIVEAIGGSWGSTELEERYEYFEKSLYGTIQRSDESHDSFLSRMEANFVELLSRNTTLEEVQAYVLLRQSTLSAEDKKRILLEHEGELKYQPVVKSFRLLGSKFFNEFQSGRASQKTKVYDANVLETPDHHEGSSSLESGHTERAFHAFSEDLEPELDQDFIDAMIAQEDADALTVSTFEGEFEEFLQETPEMFDALTSYIEARSKLVEKRKSRGFWPVKGKGKANKGRGKSFGKRSKDRDALLQRISRRRCGALGHWKAECPLNSSDKNSAPSTSASANVVFDERPKEIFHAEDTVDEVISEDEYEMPSTETCTQSCPAEETCFMLSHGRIMGVNNLSNRMASFNKRVSKLTHAHASRSNQGLQPNMPRNSRECEETAFVRCRFKHFHSAESQASEHVYSSLESFSTHAILDTGASRCIIGEKTLIKLKQALPECLRDRFRQKDSQVKFRFGNNQTLTSMYAVQIPLKHQGSKKLWLSVEVVPGQTPFLFSKRAFKMLQGTLDSHRDECFMHRVQKSPIQLATSPTGLYLINLIDICPGEETAFFQSQVPKTSDEVKGISSNGDMLELNINKNSISHGDRIDGDNQCRSAAKAETQRFQRSRSFRSKNPPAESNSRFVQHHHHATDGQHAQVDRGGHNQPLDAPSPDPGPSTGETRSDRRIRSSERSRAPCKPSRDDEPDQCATGLTGSLEGRDRGQEDQSQKGHSDSIHVCRIKSTHRGFSGNGSNTDQECGSTPIQGTIDDFTSPQLGRSRGDRGGLFPGDRECGPSEPRIQSRVLAGAFTADSSPARKFVPGGVGNECDRVRSEAQGENVCRGHGKGPRVSSMESCQVQQLDAGTSRFCPLWTAVGTRDRPGNLDRSEFHKEVTHMKSHLQDSAKMFSTFNLPDNIDQTISKLEESINISSTTMTPSSRIVCLEVYANNNSPLTDAIKNLGYSAMRFTKQDGDLSTFAGRQKLWNVIEKFQPEHIWVAPECGPWGGWNHLNKCKSPEMFDRIQEKQDQQMPHARLCVRLCQYQTKLGRHFHMEQPAGSGLPLLKELTPIVSRTAKARFDMCQFGLRIPQTNRFLRKGSQLLTTSKQMFHALHGQRCANQHSHHRIEGSVSIRGFRQRLTSFCATYCTGFARVMARNICFSPHVAIGPDEHAMVFHDEEDERPKKRAKVEQGRFKRHKTMHERSENPEMPSSSDNLVPDPALGDPNPVHESAETAPLASDASVPWKPVFDDVLRIASRVGNTRCSADSNVWRVAQEIVKQSIRITDMFVCRGTERFQVPLQAPPSSQFPLRYSISMHRETSAIHDLGVEDWHQIT